MITNQFYSVINPIVGEFVLVQFTKRTDSFFDAILLEYPYRGYMSYQDATKKRKIYNWNKIVPLNKDIVARVDEVDEKAKIVQISIAHLDDKIKESLTFTQIQEKLLIPFNENKLLDNFIKSVCVINNTDKNKLWIKLIYYIDSQRIIYNDDNDELSLWNYFTKNIHMLDEWCKLTNVNNEICETIKNIYSKRFELKYKYTSKIGIISIDGITNTKEILNNILSKLNYTYTLKYDGTPYYLFESFTNNHDEFVDELKKNNSLFIKVNYLSQETKQ